MLSWFGFFARVLRKFLFGRVERVVAGGFMWWLGRSVVKRGVGGWMCGMMASYCLAFIAGLCDGVGGGYMDLSWVWEMLSGLLRVVVVCEGGSCFGLVLGAICV